MNAWVRLQTSKHARSMTQNKSFTLLTICPVELGVYVAVAIAVDATHLVIYPREREKEERVGHRVVEVSDPVGCRREEDVDQHADSVEPWRSVVVGWWRDVNSFFTQTSVVKRRAKTAVAIKDKEPLAYFDDANDGTRGLGTSAICVLIWPTHHGRAAA